MRGIGFKICLSFRREARSGDEAIFANRDKDSVQNDTNGKLKKLHDNLFTNEPRFAFVKKTCLRKS